MRLIDEAKVINEVERFKGYLDDDMIMRIKIAINKLPTIDAEPVKHGKWIYKVFEKSRVGFFECSECGYVAFNEKSCHYCYNCGAKMDEDEISNIAKESADKISKALEKVRAKGMQKQNIKKDDEP